MKFNQNDKDILFTKLQEVTSDIYFGHIFCNFVVSDGFLMYVDIKREKNERLYFHQQTKIISEN